MPFAVDPAAIRGSSVDGLLVLASVPADADPEAVMTQVRALA